MPSAQSALPALNQEPPSLVSLEGASIRFSLALQKPEIRAPKNDKPNQAQPTTATNYQKELAKLLSSFDSRHNHWQVFSDFCEMGAISMSNGLDLNQREKREERYLQISEGYRPEERERFVQGLAYLVMALEHKFDDVLGHTFHDLELHNKWVGQFFTPYDVCRMMAKMTIGDKEWLTARIAERGFVTAQEPAVGSGAMVIALAQEMRDAGINYQQHLHVTAIDVDAKCVHMTYLQFALLHIPAIIVHGNTLSLETYSHWYTPAHIMGGWNWKLRHHSEEEGAHEIHAPPQIEAVPVESQPEQVPEVPRLQLKLF